MGSKLAIVAADFHVPFINLKALQIFINTIKNDKPDQVILAGDILDLYSISRFDNAPERADDFQYELTEGRTLLEKIRSVFDKELIFIPGNHEDRLIHFLMRGKNRALFNLSCLKLDELLSFKKYGVQLAEKYYHLNANFIIKHGSKCGQNPATAEGNSMGISGMSGHAHKANIFRKNYFGRVVDWYSLGCMCDIAAQKYAADFSFTWNNGFGRIEYTKENYQVSLNNF